MINIWEVNLMKRLASILLTATLMAGMATGCGAGSSNVDSGEKTGNATEEGRERKERKEKKEEGSSETEKEAAGDISGAEAVGEWQFVYSKGKSDYKDGTSYDYFTMSDDEYGIDSAVVIREADGGLCCDYKFNGYESSERLYGVKLNYLEEAAFQGSENDKWCLEFSGCFEDDENLRRVTVTDDDMLVIASSYTYDDEEYPEYSNTSTTQYYYLRKDDERLKDTDSLRYFDEVTVSNVVELVNSLKSNRRIIVEPGTYNFSKVTSDQINNPKAQNNYEAVTFHDISNIKIEAKDGGEVLFCVDTAYSPVVTFENGEHVSIEGITAGHNVEPGYCSGSVLSFNNVYGLDISECRLFGSGTYGIEARGTYNINVSDTDIYECTYGLLDLRNIGNAMFTNCTMRDSSDMSMLCINNAYDVTFENCTFTGNRVENDRNYFVELGEYDSATFRDCTFKDNRFFTFANREVTLENCVDENNSAQFQELAGEEKVLDKESLLAEYDDAVKQQKEMDDKLQTDSLMDQLSLNQMAFKEYDLWDGLLNNIWSYLGATLDEKDMEELREKQKAWIKEKEAKMKNDASDFQGGSMAPMIEYSSGAEFTRKRVEELIGAYLK